MTDIALSVFCKGLKKADLLSKSDPFAVFFIMDGANKGWVEHGRTETIKNNLDPAFKLAFTVPSNEPGQKLKFEVFDSDSDSKDLKKHDSLGSITCNLGQILDGGAGKRTYTEKLANEKGVTKGEITLTVLTQIRLQFGAIELPNMDRGSKSDPYLILKKVGLDSKKKAIEVKMHKSELIKNCLSPIWNPFSLLKRDLVDEVITLEVWDFDGPRSKDDLIGYAKTNLFQILEKGKDKSGFVLENPENKKKSEFGEVVILQAKED